jgi:hypothetical protein
MRRDREGINLQTLRKGAVIMKTELSLPELVLIAGTRGMLGAGVALLLADRIDEDQRKSIGWTLLLIGALSTIPLAVDIIHHRR